MAGTMHEVNEADVTFSHFVRRKNASGGIIVRKRGMEGKKGTKDQLHTHKREMSLNLGWAAALLGNLLGFVPLSAAPSSIRR